MGTGWLIGYLIGGVVVLLVVVLLLVLIASARRIGRQAADIRGALDQVEENTRGLWEVQHVNLALRSLTERLSELGRNVPERTDV